MTKTIKIFNEIKEYWKKLSKYEKKRQYRLQTNKNVKIEEIRIYFPRRYQDLVFKRIILPAENVVTEYYAVELDDKRLLEVSKDEIFGKYSPAKNLLKYALKSRSRKKVKK